MGLFEISALALLVVIAGLLIFVLVKNAGGRDKSVRDGIVKDLSDSRLETANILSRYIMDMGENLRKEHRAFQETINDSLRAADERFRGFFLQNEQQLSDMRSTMERRLTAIQDDNKSRLDEMRETVDKKLQQTLEERIGKSFQLVSERLEQVYKGLGEMQALASGVGDLKRVLGNIKARGTLGEIQLEAILQEIMAPEQYESQCAVNPGSRERVDFAVKLPAEDGEYVYLPIDAKFPMDAYHHLVDAFETSDSEKIRAASLSLAGRIKLFAKDISQKYICPPATTDFAVMFLPVEGLYAEVVRSGLMEQLQREYKVSIAGPTTVSALLNSLQMGFRTLAIQKRSGEVWQVLGAVKSEFERFSDVLAKAQRQIDSANRDIDSLIGTRMKAMERRLRTVTTLPAAESEKILIETAGQNDYGAE